MWLSDSVMQTSDGVELYRRHSGKGPACIFIHGGPGAWSHSFEALGGSVLEQHLTMYYYDQRGSGLSKLPYDSGYSLTQMIDEIDDVRSMVPDQKVYLIAHSFGGILACKYAEKHPEYVKGLILLNSTLSLPYSLRNQISFINKQLGTQFTAEHDDSVLTVFMKARAALSAKGLGYTMLSNNKAAVDKLDSVDNSAPRSYAFAQSALKNKEYFADFTKVTSNIKCPVLVITGTEDNNIGPDHYKSFKFPNQRVKIIKGGHMLYYEHNKEFAKAVFSFIK